MADPSLLRTTDLIRPRWTVSVMAPESQPSQYRTFASGASPERDVLFVSAPIAALLSLALTDWRVLANVLAGLIFAVLLPDLSGRQRQAPPGDPPLTTERGGAQ